MLPDDEDCEGRDDEDGSECRVGLDEDRVDDEGECGDSDGPDEGVLDGSCAWHLSSIQDLARIASGI